MFSAKGLSSLLGQTAKKWAGGVRTVRNDPLCRSGLCASVSLQLCKWSSRSRRTVLGCDVKTADGWAVKVPRSCPLPLMTSHECLSCVFAGAERSRLFSGLWDDCGEPRTIVCVCTERRLCVCICVWSQTLAQNKMASVKPRNACCMSVLVCASVSCHMCCIRVHCIFDVSLCQLWNGRRVVNVTSCGCQLESLRDLQLTWTDWKLVTTSRSVVHKKLIYSNSTCTIFFRTRPFLLLPLPVCAVLFYGQSSVFLFF